MLKKQIELLHDGQWKQILIGEMERDPGHYASMDKSLSGEYRNSSINPAQENIFRAFELCPYDKCHVVICGQDPYPNKKYATGLAFSVPAKEGLPPTLRNILEELKHDVTNESEAFSGDLASWAKQGVLLLNTSLTVREGESESHAQLWGDFAIHILTAVNTHKQDPLAFVLWGNRAKKIGAALEQDKCAGPRSFLYAPHPSPLSAYRGFFGSRPFTKVNSFLAKYDIPQIDW